MRITRVRVAVQAFFLLLFVAFVYLTQFGRLRGFPTSLLLELDPLVALTTGVAARLLYGGLIVSLVLFAATLLLGRVFCGWICPFGTLQQFTAYLGGRGTERRRIDANRYRPAFAVKFYVLAFILAAALFGSAQNGLLDPIPLLHRSVTIGVLPLADGLGLPIYVRPHYHQHAWLVIGLFAALLGMTLLIPRFFCRTLCPLGALLGWLSRFSLLRIERDPDLCSQCDKCLKTCEGAADPHSALRKSECFVCFNCLEDCPHGALSFGLLPPVAHEVAAPATGRRAAIFAGLSGLLFYFASRTSGDTSENFRPEVVRPPGSVPEDEFLARCIKCDQCLRVCPTNVLQPALWEAGIEGLWTPVMNHRLGYCELNCTLCGQVCPTGAIQKISIDQKLGRGRFAELGPVVVGTAFYDRGRCLPWAMDKPCVVCEEVCPVSPKAIYTRTVSLQNRWGESIELKRPHIDPDKCIGCGICEHECPVVDRPAVYVTAVGETRSKERSLLLERERPESLGAGGRVGRAG